MELLTVTIKGYKRFRATTSLQANGKLVALLGPNEAGKSSLLQAITLLKTDGPVDIAEISRGMAREELSVVGRFLLSPAELEKAGFTSSRCMIVSKSGRGQRTIGFDPPAPIRDTSHRQAFVDALIGIETDEPTFETVGDGEPELLKVIATLATDIANAGEKLKPALLKELREVRDRFEVALDGSPTNYGENLLKQWERTISLEIAPTPLDHAFNALRDGVPEFLTFDEDARDLASNYSISALREGIPTALRNLAEVAGLDFKDLFEAIDAGQTHRITTIERRASDTLARKFKAAWQQSGIEVAIRFQGDLLEVQIVEVNSEFTPLAERSDGLRQFVALQMFATRNHTENPVLLIDEADQRLHYDAQADLVQMLARQQVAPKVIYTTHSAGCLPEDLGNGVRTIVPNNEDGSSRIVNRFWSDREPGLAPLLIGLGASTMAFFPTRRAVMVEGPSDMLLYPTLFREALELTTLGFQFVPGLSRKNDPRAIAPGQGVLYLVDGDDGGTRIGNRLKELGIPDPDVFVLRNKSGSALELEDFVREDALTKAANAILAKWHAAATPIGLLAAGNTRMATLEAEFLEHAGVDLPKVDLAYELLDGLAADPSLTLIDPRRRDAFIKVAGSVIRRFAQ